MSEKVSDFELKHKASSYSEGEGGKLISISNWETEGDVDVYGAVYGSLKVVHDINNPDAESGTCSWAGEGFLPDGSKTIGFLSGTWEKAGNHVWKLSMTGRDSAVGSTRVESTIALETSDLVWDSLQSITFLAKLVVYTASFLSLWEALVIHTGLTWIIKKYSHLISLEIVYKT